MRTGESYFCPGCEARIVVIDGTCRDDAARSAPICACGTELEKDPGMAWVE